MKRIIQLVLVVVAAFVAWSVYKSLKQPLEFAQIKKERTTQVVKRLKDIRKAQLAYKAVNGEFTGDFDSLITFVKQDSLPLIRKIGALNDSMIDAGWTEKKALKEGLIIRDTLKVACLDSLFGKDYSIEKIKFIPYTNNQQEFQMGSTIVNTASGIKVHVFEAKAHNNFVYESAGEEFRQDVINLNESARMNEKYPGLKVGSLVEANNNAGNWE